MASPEYRAYIVSDEEPDEGDFVIPYNTFRCVHFARLNPSRRLVELKTRRSDFLSKSGLADGSIRMPTIEQIMESGEVYSADLYYIPYPLIDVSTLKCECGNPCVIKISNRSKIKNREQAVCATKGPKKCKYRQWFDTAHIQCACRVPADITKSRGLTKPENKGREFFRCGHYKTKTRHTCGFMRWKNNLEIYLGKDWGESKMPVEDALNAVVKMYKANLNKSTCFEEISNRVPYDVCSTLAGHCRKTA